MIDTGRWVVYTGAMLLKVVLAVVGLLVVPFTSPTNKIWGNAEHPVPPQWYRPGQPEWWRDYVWRAWRNVVNNVRYYLVEPTEVEYTGAENPDDNVWRYREKSATRVARSGQYIEYWKVWATDKKIWEFRIGWKFSKVPGFAPTLQFGPRNR